MISRRRLLDFLKSMCTLKLANTKPRHPVVVMNLDKAICNYLKHQVSFYEAGPCIRETKAIYEQDPCESEDRHRIIALSPKGRLLKVVFTKRHDGLTTRVISARRISSKSEEAKKFYEKFQRD